MPGGSVGGYAANNHGISLYSYADEAAWLQPSLVYFVRDRIGIGAYVGYEFGRRDSVALESVTTHGLGAGLIAMAELPLGPKLGLLSVLQVGYLHRLVRRDAGFDPDYDVDRAIQNGHLGQVVVAGSVPFLIHASSSVAFGFGPTVRFAPYVTASSDYANAKHARPLQIGASSWIGVSF
jgi:hypothetical protein